MKKGRKIVRRGEAPEVFRPFFLRRGHLKNIKKGLKKAVMWGTMVASGKKWWTVG